MTTLTWNDIAVHNAAELREIDHAAVSPQRVPEAVRGHLNAAAQLRMREAAGVELRFVADGPVELDLSVPELTANEGGELSRFHGRYQNWRGRGEAGAVLRLERQPTTLRIDPPKRLADTPRVTGDFSPAVTRLILPILAGPVVLHDLRPDPGVTVRPPTADELPTPRLLFYGTSITHGAGSSAAHLTYPQICGSRLRADTLNLGVGGSCHCEPELADYLAHRNDWDAAILALSVNMMSFTDDDFAARVRYFVHTLAQADPNRPVFAITLWPYYADLPDHDQHDQAQRFRQHLRDAAASCPTPNVHLLEGPDLLTRFDGLTCDLIHPGDHAMIEMGCNLADALRPHL